MSAFRPLLASAVGLALGATAAVGDEIACAGPFAADSSEARLIESFGKENVVTGEVDGPEGSTIIATTVFPDDPEKLMQFSWWDETTYSTLAYVELPTGAIAPGGLKPGLTVKDVEAINGAPFTMTGFWWDYGGTAGFATGKLAEIPGGCHLSISFQPAGSYPEDLDVEPVTGDREVLSSEPLLEKLDVRVEAISIGYPHPDYAEGGAEAAD